MRSSRELVVRVHTHSTKEHATKDSSLMDGMPAINARTRADKPEYEQTGLTMGRRVAYAPATVGKDAARVGVLYHIPSVMPIRTPTVVVDHTVLDRVTVEMIVRQCGVPAVGGAVDGATLCMKRNRKHAASASASARSGQCHPETDCVLHTVEAIQPIHSLN